MDIQKNSIPAGKFKAECLREIEHVKQTGEPLVVTKRGKPIVKILPISEDTKETYFGCCSDTMEIMGDIMLPIDETWNADQGEI